MVLFETIWLRWVQNTVLQWRWSFLTGRSQKVVLGYSCLKPFAFGLLCPTRFHLIPHPLLFNFFMKQLKNVGPVKVWALPEVDQFCGPCFLHVGSLNVLSNPVHANWPAQRDQGASSYLECSMWLPTKISPPPSMWTYLSHRKGCPSCGCATALWSLVDGHQWKSLSHCPCSIELPILQG